MRYQRRYKVSGDFLGHPIVEVHTGHNGQRAMRKVRRVFPNISLLKAEFVGEV